MAAIKYAVNPIIASAPTSPTISIRRRMAGPLTERGIHHSGPPPESAVAHTPARSHALNRRSISAPANLNWRAAVGLTVVHQCGHGIAAPGLRRPNLNWHTPVALPVVHQPHNGE